MKKYITLLFAICATAFAQPTVPINNARFTGTSLINSGAFLYAASGGSVGVQSGGTFYFQNGGLFAGDAAAFRTAIGAGSGAGTVTSVSVVTANGVSGSVATATTTPAITLTLGAITPSSVSTGAGSFTTLSASGVITSTVASGEVFAAASATTAPLYLRFQNTGGASYIGIDNSSGGAFGSGAAYALVSFVPSGRVIENMVSGVTITSVSSTGLAVTGAVSSTGNITVDSAGDASLVLDRGTTSNYNQILFRTAGAATGGWDIFGSNATNQTLSIYSQQAGAAVGVFSSTGLAVTGVTTSTGKFTYATGNATSGGFNSNFNGASAYGVHLVDTTDTSGAPFAIFGKASGATIGSITRVTTTDAVAYNTTSDARLKTNIRDFTAADAGRIIDGLQPRWFDWKASELTETVDEQVVDDSPFVPVGAPPVEGSIAKVVTTDKVDFGGKPDVRYKTVQRSRPVTDKARIAKHVADNKSIIGFIAQEEAAVDPALVRAGAVTVGDDDPTNISKQWARSDAALVPILVAELKALRARVATLEAKLK